MSDPSLNNSPGFQPQKMVGWYDVSQLAQTGIKAVISTLFGTFADKRETLGALNPPKTSNYSQEDEIWVDYMADTGDGFDSTFTMVSCLAQKSLKIDGTGLVLPNAKVLILGGDQVYPTATRFDYKNRFEGPIEAAFPRERGVDERDLFAVPGNHDWYDGLNNFSKLFLQNRSIGNWITKQNRSYFAIKISDGVWIWAIDIQLDADVDQPQKDYFGNHVSAEMKKGDKVILCTAEPSWIFSNTIPSDASYHNLKFFEKTYIVEREFELIAVLSGDLHHYSRYSKIEGNGQEKCHKITAGGGGAFLHPTHNLPGKLSGLREGDFKLKKTFPSKNQSRKMLIGNLWFPVHNWSFGLFMAGIYLLFDWVLNIFSRFAHQDGETGIDLVSKIRTMGLSQWPGVAGLFGNAIYYCPPCLIILILIIVGLTMFTDTKSSKSKWVWLIGLVHGLFHVFWMCGSFWMFSFFNFAVFSNYTQVNLNSAHLLILTFIEVFIVAGYVAGIIMGLYLLKANLIFGIHDNEAFSSMKIENWKNFLRLHFTREKLTIYPIGIKKIAKWKWNPGKRVFETHTFPSAELIEEPIVILLK